MPQESPDDTPLFLETTVQIDRVIGTDARRRAIRASTRNRPLCTSGHVLGEFNRTLIRDAIIFRDLLRTSPDVGDAVKRLPSFIPRRTKRTVDLLASLGFDNDKQLTLERLEMFIEWRGHDHFWDSIADHTSEVGCVLQSWTSEPDGNGDYDLDGLKCLKNRPPSCKVMPFIERNREALESLVASGKQSNRDNVVSAANAFEGILAGDDVPYGEKSNCYRISDTLIALEAPDEAEIYSTDGDVKIICEILGKDLKTLGSPID